MMIRNQNGAKIILHQEYVKDDIFEFFFLNVRGINAKKRQQMTVLQCNKIYSKVALINEVTPWRKTCWQW